MENQTKSSEGLFVLEQDSINLWYTSISISGILLVLASYLLIALVYHKVKIERPRKQPFFQLSLENKLTVLSRFTCIIIGCLSFLNQLIEFVELLSRYDDGVSPHFDFKNKLICETISILAGIVFSFGNGLVYLFLWFRQRVFYIHPSLKNLNSKAVQAFSTSIMVVWVLYYFCLCVSTVALVRFDFSPEEGCFIQENSHYVSLYLLMSYYTVAIFMQLLLLVLFICPILKQTSFQNQQSNNDRQSRLMKRVKKAVILGFICFTTDFLPFVEIQLALAQIPNFLYFSFSFNLLINHLVTIASFDHWKQLLWPWNLKRNVSEPYKNKRKSERHSSFSTMSTRDTGIRLTNIIEAV